MFTAIFLPLTLAAGFWQLQRAEEKRNLLSQRETMAEQAPLAVQAVLQNKDIGWLSYRKVRVCGVVQSPVFLLDNKVRRGRAGFEMLVPVRLAGGGQPDIEAPRASAEESFIVIINLGWIAGGLDRSRLPELPEVSGDVCWQGYVYVSPGRPLVLADDQWSDTNSPLLIQSIDFKKMQEFFPSPVFPFAIKLTETVNSQLEVGWPIVNVQPQKHLGYAVQWFTMSTALVLLTVFANSNLGAVLRRRRN